MATANDHDSPPIGLLGHPVPEAPTAPYPPSPVEAENYFYGIPSKPRLVARSSTDVWVEPRGFEAYLIPKESSPLGFHPLQEIWETKVGPAMVEYLDTNRVECTSLDPIRMGYAGDSSPPAIIWMGVLRGSLTAEIGVQVAIHCKGILSAHGIDDIHLEIRESEVIRSAKLYKPVFTSNPTAQVREPFSTAVGLPIAATDTPSIGGTGGFYISDPRYPGKIYLVTARHVVFCSDTEPNELYQHNDSDPSQRRRSVLLFSDSAVEKYTMAVKSEIRGEEITIEQLERRLKGTEQLDEEEAEAERKAVQRQLENAKQAIVTLEKFLADVSRDWKERKDRVLGHVVLSPPLGLNVGEEGFTEDWAVIEIDKSKVDSTNFVGNVVDLGTTIPVAKFTFWMCPHPANPPSFKYPGNRLLRFHGFIPDEEIWKPSSRTLDHQNDPVIMVIKNGDASGLTVGRLNTIRSFTRYYLEGKPSQMSKEITVLPRDSKSWAFSEPGDSGSAVIDGMGRFVGLLTGGAGTATISDCTYVTSGNFLRARMSLQGLQADFFPSLGA
ncbi:hypothetical protein FRC17_001769 [Serendipita sp. 399]|nr:hypothetical protein FRC17_001769 [Serendipita sp. 399]